MTQTKNMNDDYLVSSINHQFKMIKISENILNLGGESISDILNKNKVNFSEIKITSDLLYDHLDKISIEKLWNSKLSNLEKKYDLIILNDLIEQIDKPEIFLKHISNYLLDDGSIIITIKNFSYIKNILQILNGTFLKNNFLNSNRNVYDLDTFILFLSRLNYSIIKLDRIYENSKYDSTNNLNEFSFPSQVLESFNEDPESKVVLYIFRIIKNDLDDSQMLNWISKFPKNYFMDSMRKKFDFYSNLEQSIKDKDNVILGLENSLKETKIYFEQVLKDKEKANKS